MKYHAFFPRIWKDVAKCVVCCSRDGHLKGNSDGRIEKVLYLYKPGALFVGHSQTVQNQI